MVTSEQPTTGATITGATTEQIAAAVERALVDEPYRYILGVEQQTRGVIAASAIYLVSPDHRIVPATRVIEDADVAAIGRALAFVKIGKRMTGPILMKERTTLFLAMWEAAGAITDNDLARLARILAGDAARTEGTP